MKRKKPETAAKWLIEIAAAYNDAVETIPFGPLAGIEITEDNLFHIAPSICIKFRGLNRSKKNIKKATDAALSSYVASEDMSNENTTTPYMSFAFCYIASHYGLDLIGEKEGIELLEYIEAHQSVLEDFIAT